ncbi:response regulator [Alkalihalobacillus sp. LMS39]|uniref:response regulator n=1 Tax=Alkalihalobacillus sp. LMS39 TaxID=2924032 RepID=UPI001FB459B2|nr:response regulator [Alkalihalobacillus sp. LMS39]UOE94452.1 response regulator [Alkalihalobacillus sp. LMS39]
MIRAVLIDDEPLAIQLLQSKLKAMNGYQIVGTYTSELKIKDQVESIDFDVAFIDINLKSMSGIDLAEYLLSKKGTLQIVFVTAYDEYAIKAFELHAVDYLLKPVSNERLKKTTERLRETLSLFKNQEVALTQTVTITCFLELMVYFNGELVNWKTNKVKELFAYLLTHHRKYVDRDVIIEALWPDYDFKKSKIHLHTCIYHLRKLLQALGFEKAISFSNKCYSLTLKGIKTDVEEWHDLLHGFELDKNGFTEANFDRVLTIYIGKYFERNDYEWAKEQALTYHYRMNSFLKEIEIIYSERHKYDKSLQCLLLLMQDDPYSEDLIKKAFHLLINTDQKSRIHSLYRSFVLRLEQDLALEPTGELQDYYRELVSQ